MNQHRKDRHEDKWDSFSLYLVRKSDHIKELESLILRIADPKGNKVKGRLTHAENMTGRLKGKIRSRQEKNLDAVLNVSRDPAQKKASRRRAPAKAAGESHAPTLAAYAGKRFVLQRVYKGRTYKAAVLADGTISYNGKRYNSPSLAAVSVTGRPMNGWSFWRVQSSSGEWVKLDSLRHS